MSYKKTALRIGILALLMAGGAVAYLYFRYHKPSDLPYYVPADADHVLFLNTKKCLAAVQFSQQKPDRTWLDSLRKLKYFQNISDPRDLGINLFSDLIYYQKKDTAIVLLQMNNESVFSAFIKDKAPKGAFSAVKDNKQYKYVTAADDDFALGWNTDVVAFVLHSGRFQQAVLERIIAGAVLPRPKQSVMQQPAFKGMFEKPDGLGVLYTANPGGIKYLTDATTRQAAAYITLKQNTLQLHGALFTATPSEAVIKNIVPLTVDTTAGKVYMQLDPSSTFVRSWFNKHLHESVIAAGEKAAGKQPEQHYINILADEFKGYIKVAYMGNILKENSFTTYDYDDNFNKVEKVTIKRDTLPSLNAFFNVSYNAEFEAFFNSQGYKDLYFFNDPGKHSGPCCITNDKDYKLTNIDADMNALKTMPKSWFHADIDIDKLHNAPLFSMVPSGNLRQIYVTFADTEQNASRFVISAKFSGSPFSGIIKTYYHQIKYDNTRHP